MVVCHLAGLDFTPCQLLCFCGMCNKKNKKPVQPSSSGSIQQLFTSNPVTAIFRWENLPTPSFSNGSPPYPIWLEPLCGLDPAMASTHQGPNLPKELSTSKKGCGLAKLPGCAAGGIGQIAMGQLFRPALFRAWRCIPFKWVIAHISLGYTVCISGFDMVVNFYEPLTIPGMHMLQTIKNRARASARCSPTD